MKHLLTVAPILKIVDLDKEFVACMHAFLEGLGVFLMQENWMVAYESIKIKPHENNYVVNDLELASITHVLNMWRHYLLGKNSPS